MKKLIYTIALFGLVVMTACSGDSPSSQPVPTVVPDEWAVVSLTVSDPTPDIGATILVDAHVQKNGVDAPNGTSVEFLASGGQFPNGTTEATVSTAGGHAAVQFVAEASGNYLLQARVRAVTRQVTVTYRDPEVDEELAIDLPLVPDIGSFDGGETVYLRGTGIRNPVEVTFDVAGVLFPASIVEVLESDPLSAPGQIEVTTPAITGIDRTQDQVAHVIVKRGVGTAIEQMITLHNAFTFLAGVEPPTAPVLYGLDPAFGGRLGGEQVTVFGRNLDLATSATFTFRGSPLAAEILSASPDGLQMLISTPRFSATALEQSEFADFGVDSPVGASNVITQAYLVIADDPTPEIASLSPIAGPLGGGTLVSIFGSGFHVPVQVRFGNLTATDVNVIDDHTPADQDVITCLSPDYSQQGQVPPVTVDVTVTNMESGKISNALQFTYGDSLFISGNSPTEGYPGDQVVIYGAGFEDPLQVFFGATELEVQSVSGTEILVRFPADLPVQCGDTTGQFRVRLIESNQETTGGTFILRGNQPTVTDVEPTFVQADESGNYVSPSDITVFGADFADTLLVKINSFVMASSAVTVVDETTIEVVGIPAPNDFGLVFNTTSCITDDGLQGLRKAPTPVDVSVVNLPGNCTDTLVGGLIYEPGDDECVASSFLAVSLDAFPEGTGAGTCSATAADLTISNANGGGDLQIFQINLAGPFSFDNTPGSTTLPGFIVPAFTIAAPIPIYFCPSADGHPQAGNLSIQHNASNVANPFLLPLSANEAYPVLSLSAETVDFGVQTAGTGVQALPLTISNDGTGALNWAVSGVTDTVFLRTGPGSPVNSGTIAAGASAALEVALNTSSGVTGPVDVTLTITAAESDAEGSPKTVRVVATINP
jgi:hypothetical protein